jgi:DNA-binding IclR family transcriptional regulator
MARSPSGESVLTRVVRLLGAFDVDTPQLSLSRLARRADLPIATAHRLAKELRP